MLSGLRRPGDKPKIKTPSGQKRHIIRRKLRNQFIDGIIFTVQLFMVFLRIAALNIGPGRIAGKASQIVERRPRRMFGIPVGGTPHLQIDEIPETPRVESLIIKINPNPTIIRYIVVFFAQLIIEIQLSLSRIYSPICCAISYKNDMIFQRIILRQADGYRYILSYFSTKARV